MRKKCTDQVSIFDLFSNHDIGKELKVMSERLDRHREMLACVAIDLHLMNSTTCDTAYFGGIDIIICT